MKHRKIKQLRIDELSAVDRPAAEPALAAIMKRNSAEENMTAITKAQADFSAAVREVAKRDGCLAYAAMAKARQERPELFAAAYAGRVIAVAPPGAIQAPVSSVSKAASDFQSKVGEIAKRDGVAGHIAMQRARLEAPALFASAYAR